MSLPIHAMLPTPSHVGQPGLQLCLPCSSTTIDPCLRIQDQARPACPHQHTRCCTEIPQSSKLLDCCCAQLCLIIVAMRSSWPPPGPPLLLQHEPLNTLRLLLQQLLTRSGSCGTLKRISRTPSHQGGCPVVAAVTEAAASSNCWLSAPPPRRASRSWCWALLPRSPP